MPRIEQRIIGTSLYMYTSVESAIAGSRSGGSGVLIGQPCESLESLVHLYAVTNAHVVEHNCVIARAMKWDGYPRIFDQVERSDWELHPDGEDVAVCWLGTALTDDDQELQWVPRDWLATKADLSLVPQRTDPDWPFPWSTGPVVAGEETFSVVRFIGYDGVDTNQPSVHFGNLSSPELVSVKQPVRNRDQKSLLVEARSLAGYSGAPVFAYRTNTYVNGGIPPVDKALLLGIGWGHIKHPDNEDNVYGVEVETPGAPTPGRYNSGIMAVVPAWKLLELLDQPKVVDVRRKYEEHIEEQGGAEMDVAGDEFERFREVTRKLATVPKAEVDRKLKEHRESREKGQQG